MLGIGAGAGAFDGGGGGGWTIFGGGDLEPGLGTVVGDGFESGAGVVLDFLDPIDRVLPQFPQNLTPTFSNPLQASPAALVDYVTEVAILRNEICFLFIFL
jgi:hypothetical protein